MTGQPPLTKRLTTAHWVAIDAAVAVVTLAGGLVYIAVRRNVPGHQEALLYALIVPYALPLALRRRYPLPVFGVTLAAAIAFSCIAAITDTVTGATYALYTVAAQEGRRWSLGALLAAEAGVAVTFLLVRTPASNPANEAQALLVQLAVWVTADSLRRRRAYAASLRELWVNQALTAERLRIARELHDGVAHAMSVIAVQAGAGGHVIATRPAEAAKALDAIESIARSALAEMRSVLGVLRRGEPALASFAPAPGIGDLGALAGQVTEVGLPVALRVSGEPRALPPGVELAAYRVVQEALTNVVRHAVRPGSVTVLIRYADQDLTVEVTDDGHGPARAPLRAAFGGATGDGTGHGLLGMAERVSLLGGELQAGRRDEGGFRVTARLPVPAGTG